MFAHGGSAVPLGVYLLRWCGEKENSLAVLYVIFAVGNFLIRGLTRRLRRGRWDCRTEGGKYFLSLRKKVPKKAGGTATTGKSLLLPILPAGLATSRVIKLDSYPQRLCALLCSPISAVKMGGPFSLRCLSPLVSPAGGAGQTQMAVLGIVSCYVGGLAASMGRPVFQFAVGVNHIQIMLVGRFDVTWIFLQGKRPA